MNYNLVIIKQNDKTPDLALGWLAERFIKLGESLPTTLLSIVDDL